MNPPPSIPSAISLDVVQAIVLAIILFGAMMSALTYILRWLAKQNEKADERFAEQTRESSQRLSEMAERHNARQDTLTDRFLKTMDASTTAVVELTATVRESRAHAREEHARIVDAIGKMSAREAITR